MKGQILTLDLILMVFLLASFFYLILHLENQYFFLSKKENVERVSSMVALEIKNLLLDTNLSSCRVVESDGSYFHLYGCLDANEENISSLEDYIPEDVNFSVSLYGSTGKVVDYSRGNTVGGRKYTFRVFYSLVDLNKENFLSCIYNGDANFQGIPSSATCPVEEGVLAIEVKVNG